MANIMDAKVNMNGREYYIMFFPVGDESGDGHGLCDYYLVRSNKPIKKVGDAHLKVKSKFGFDLGDICNQENTLNQKVTEKLEGMKVKFSGFEKIRKQMPLTTKDVLDLWLYLLNTTDSSLKLEEIEVPCLHPERGINTPGYGCF